MASLDVAHGAAADGLLAPSSARTAQVADIAAYIQSLSSGPRPTGKDNPLLNKAE